MTDPEITEVMDREFNADIINIINIFKDFKENINIMKREMETMKENWTDLLSKNICDGR